MNVFNVKQKESNDNIQLEIIHNNISNYIDFEFDINQIIIDEFSNLNHYKEIYNFPFKDIIS